MNISELKIGDRVRIIDCRWEWGDPVLEAVGREGTLIDPATKFDADYIAETQEYFGPHWVECDEGDIWPCHAVERVQC